MLLLFCGYFSSRVPCGSLEFQDKEGQITVKQFYENFTSPDSIKKFKQEIKNYKERCQQENCIDDSSLLCEKCQDIVSKLPLDKAEKFFVLDCKTKKDKLIYVKQCAPEYSKIDQKINFEVREEIKFGKTDNELEDISNNENSRIYGVYVLVNRGELCVLDRHRILQQVHHLLRFYGVIYKMTLIGDSSDEILIKVFYTSSPSVKLLLYLGLSNPMKYFKLPGSVRVGEKEET